MIQFNLLRMQIVEQFLCLLKLISCRREYVRIDTPGVRNLNDVKIYIVC